MKKGAANFRKWHVPFTQSVKVMSKFQSLEVASFSSTFYLLVDGDGP